jgi:hypothetical protein
MSITVTANEMSPRGASRLYAILYIVTLVFGLAAQFGFSESMIAWNNAATTGANILNDPSRFGAGFSLYLIEMTAQIAMTTVLYSLLKPVSGRLALLMVILTLIGCIIKIVSRLLYYSPLLILGSASLNAFSKEQLDALALLLLKINDHGAALAMLFFGFGTILAAVLILRSTFLPRALGVLSLISGIGWTTFLWPPLGYAMFNVIAPFALLSSLAMIGWMFVKGVDDQRWREQAELAQRSIWR